MFNVVKFAVIALAILVGCGSGNTSTGPVAISEPVGKLSVGANKAGGMHNLILRQPCVNEYGLSSSWELSKEGLKFAFANQYEGGLEITLYFDAHLIPREVGYFGFLYSFQGDRVKAESSFIGYDDSGSKYIKVIFVIPYTGTLAQQSLLGKVAGQGKLSVWYVEYSPEDYDNLWTTASLDFTDLDFTLVRIKPIGEFPDSQLDLRWEQVVMSRDITVPLKGLSFNIHREPRVRFFEISAGGFTWIVLIPFAPEADIKLWGNGATTVFPPRLE